MFFKNEQVDRNEPYGGINDRDSDLFHNIFAHFCLKKFCIVNSMDAAQFRIILLSTQHRHSLDLKLYCRINKQILIFKKKWFMVMQKHSRTHRSKLFFSELKYLLVTSKESEKNTYKCDLGCILDYFLFMFFLRLENVEIIINYDIRQNRS